MPPCCTKPCLARQETDAVPHSRYQTRGLLCWQSLISFSTGRCLSGHSIHHVSVPYLSMQLPRRSISGRKYLRLFAQVSVAAMPMSNEAADPALCDARSFPVGGLGAIAVFAGSRSSGMKPREATPLGSRNGWSSHLSTAITSPERSCSTTLLDD